jgi:nicotinamide phosphoribosyltransferase
MKKIIDDNICTDTDSYKQLHYLIMPDGTTKAYDYFEARKGARFPETVFFGLQFLLKELEGVQFDQNDIDEAREEMTAHFGYDKFNTEGWTKMLANYGGRLPIEIYAVAEGTPVPVGNVLFSVENTGDEFWLPGHLETILTHVWHPMTVATLSREIKKLIVKYLDKTSDNAGALPFLLHDFGFRGVEDKIAAGRGGAGHLVNFLGTDTLKAMKFIEENYGVPYAGIGYSVFATEHSLMTSRGTLGEPELIQAALDKIPNNIISMVADSYDYYRFVRDHVGKQFKQQIIDRNAKNPGAVFVIRPDSCTPTHKTPEELVLWTFQQLEADFGVTVNSKGYKLLHPAVGVIWGDGIDIVGMEKIFALLFHNGYDTSKLPCGSGGGLLQKINRDTQRCAFKCSAQLQNGTWVDIQKNPLDASKKSKAGKLALIKENGEFKTIRLEDLGERENLLKLVYRNGEVINPITFDQVRKNAEL